MSQRVTSSGAKRHGVVWSVGLSLAVLKSFLPYDNLMDAVSFVIDSVDPYGFNTILTRSFFDGESEMIREIFSGYADISLRQCIRDSKENYPGMEDKTYTNICKQYTDLWTISIPETSSINKSCYGNYNPPSVVSQSGQPSGECDPVYINYYNQYTSDNKDKYIRDNIITSQTISNVVGFTVPDSTGSSNLEDITEKIKPIRMIAISIVALLILSLVLFILFVIG